MKLNRFGFILPGEPCIRIRLAYLEETFPDVHVAHNPFNQPSNDLTVIIEAPSYDRALKAVRFVETGEAALAIA